MGRMIFIIVLINVCLTFGGPIWPNTFRVDLFETFYSKRIVVNENFGAWYYDWANKRARMDHLNGQKDYFCQNQDLSPDNPQDDCHLIFTSSSEMYTHYPNQKACCRMCPPGAFCTPLLPNWIENGTYGGTEVVEGKECQVWYEDGQVAEDYWMETDAGIPCRYYETSPLGDHPIFYKNITFDQETYSTEPIPDSVFEVPDYCNQDCPNPVPPPFKPFGIRTQILSEPFSTHFILHN